MSNSDKSQNKESDAKISGSPDSAAAKKKKNHLPDELIECAHRHGIHGKVVWIPSMKMDTIRKKLTYHVLLLMEDAYEKYGFWPRTQDDLRKRFPKPSIVRFPLAEEVTAKRLFDARLDARRRFLDWYLDNRKKNRTINSEQFRLGQIRRHANKRMLSDVMLIQGYRDIRGAIRKGEMDPQLEVPDHSIEFLKHLAKESVDVSWRGGL